MQHGEYAAVGAHTSHAVTSHCGESPLSPADASMFGVPADPPVLEAPADASMFGVPADPPVLLEASGSSMT